jgi:hypothetical protein
MIDRSNPKDIAAIEAAGSSFIDAVFLAGNGIELERRGLFEEAARSFVLRNFIDTNPQLRPSPELAHWFVSANHTEILYLLNKADLLDYDVRLLTRELVKTAIANEERDAQDIERFSDLP